MGTAHDRWLSIHCSLLQGSNNVSITHETILIEKKYCNDNKQQQQQQQQSTSDVAQNTRSKATRSKANGTAPASATPTAGASGYKTAS